MKKLLMFICSMAIAVSALATNLYHYSEETLEYIGTTVAKPDYRRPGQFRVPASATTKPPPEVNLNEVAVWSKHAKDWKKVPDWRGAVFYKMRDGRKSVEILSINTLQPIDTVAIAPPKNLVAPVWNTEKAAWEEGPAAFRGVALSSKRQAVAMAQQEILQEKALLVLIDAVDALSKGQQPGADWARLVQIKNQIQADLTTYESRR